MVTTLVMKTEGGPTGPPEVIYHSRLYVPPRKSHTGFGYKPGDEIPLEEAQRQGLVPVPRMIGCPRCKGHGTHAVPPPRGHKPKTCRCPGCGPCKRCEGRMQIDATQEV